MRSTASGARRSAGAAGLWGLVRARLLSFGMILGIGFLLIVSLAFSAGIAALSRWWDPLSGWATVTRRHRPGAQHRCWPPRCSR